MRGLRQRGQFIGTVALLRESASESQALVQRVVLVPQKSFPKLAKTAREDCSKRYRPGNKYRLRFSGGDGSREVPCWEGRSSEV
jgi:hypothetical protein